MVSERESSWRNRSRQLESDSSVAFEKTVPRDLASLSSGQVGALGEALASAYLAQRGYEILERGYRCPEGEADIIAYDHNEDQIVLVEVKTRRGAASGLYPEEAVDAAKQRRYRRIAACYALDRFPVASMRFDCIAVRLWAQRTAEIHHVFNLFGWAGAK